MTEVWYCHERFFFVSNHGRNTTGHRNTGVGGRDFLLCSITDVTPQGTVIREWVVEIFYCVQ
jgi:hypothetical protein